MPVAVHISQTEEYVIHSERELPRDAQTVFIIGVMPGWKRLEIMGRLGGIKAGPEETSEAAFVQAFAPILPEILRAGLRGWRGFKDADGGEVVFRTDGAGAPSLAALALIDSDTQIELASAIMALNQPGAKTLGN
jgi:hypothetical protein